MKQASRRLRRMERHHKMRKASPLNLVSLMDIFTILVFFLLVNSSSAPQLPSQRDMALPKSFAQTAPQETPVLVVTPVSLLLQGRELARVADLLAEDSEQQVIDPLLRALQTQRTQRQLQPRDADDETGDAITIMGDENIPYRLMRRILATCQEANYTDIAFAAQQQPRPNP